MGLGGEREFPLNAAQSGHQLVRAAGDEPGRQDGLYAGKTGALLQPKAGFRQGLGGGLPQDVGAVAVHVHLAHKAAHARLIQQLHQRQRGRAVQGGEQAGPGGGAAGQRLDKDAVSLLGVGQVGKLAFLGKSGMLQPAKQLHIHAQAAIGILPGMGVQVHQAGENELIAEILHRKPLEALRQPVEQARYPPVLADQNPMGLQRQLAAGGRIGEIAL